MDYNNLLGSSQQKRYSGPTTSAPPYQGGSTFKNTMREIAEAIVPQKIQDLYLSRYWGPGQNGPVWRS